MPKTDVFDVVVVDDEKEMALVLKDLLECEGLRTEALTDPAQALRMAREGRTRIVLSDVNMPRMTGLDLVREVRRFDPNFPVLLLTAFASLEAAMEAVRAGAWHFLTKPVVPEDLLLWVKRALEEVRLRAEVAGLRQTGDDSLESLNPAMGRMLSQVPRLAQLSGTVLVVGESGTGKERIARALHFRSHRHEKPFVPVNCGAIPETLIESELFGHEEGAFTGASRVREGLFEVAGEGTLFLDEIGELPLLMQAKLLRVLQEGRFRRVGAGKELEFKARVVAATNRDLADEVQQGRFREDLYYRLNVLPLTLPPLRERREDVIPLAQRFLERHCQRAGFGVRRLSKGAQALLEGYGWPGNIRELGNVIERVVAFSDAEVLEPEDFGFLKEAKKVPNQDSLAGDWPTLELLERRYINKVLGHTGGHRARACELLGVDAKTLYRKLQKSGDLPDVSGKMPE